MSQYKVTTKEDLGCGICKLTLEDCRLDVLVNREIYELAR